MKSVNTNSKFKMVVLLKSLDWILEQGFVSYFIIKSISSNEFDKLLIIDVFWAHAAPFFIVQIEEHKLKEMYWKFKRILLEEEDNSFFL